MKHLKTGLLLTIFTYTATGLWSQVPKTGEIVLPELNNCTLLSNSSLQGKFLIIDFWATWCGPCIASFPHLEQLQKKYNNKIAVIALSDEKIETVRQFVKKKSYQYITFGCDSLSSVFKQFNVKARPATILISPGGKFLWAGHSGDLDTIISAALVRPEVIPNNDQPPYIAQYYSDRNKNNPLRPGLFSLGIEYSNKNDPYYASINKNKNEKAKLSYSNVSVLEIIQDLLSLNSTRISNKREDLDTIYLNVEVKAEDKHLLSGVIDKDILKYLQMAFGFSITTVKKEVQGYTITSDPAMLHKYKETIAGGGFVQRKNDSIYFYRVKLDQISSYLENKKKQFMQLDSSPGNESYTFTIKEYPEFDEMVAGFERYGLFFKKSLLVIDLSVIE